MPVTLGTKYATDDSGWTVFSNPASIHYVSDSLGSNSYDGLYPDHTLGGSHGPWKTLAYAMSQFNALTNYLPHWLLLKKDDMFVGQAIGAIGLSGNYDGVSDPISDPAHINPVVIGSYDPANPTAVNPATGGARPFVDVPPYQIDTSGYIPFGTGYGYNNGGNFFAIVGIDFGCHWRDPDDPAFDSDYTIGGVLLNRPYDWILFEDIAMHHQSSGIQTAGDPNTSSFPWAPWMGTLIIRRSSLYEYWYRPARASGLLAARNAQLTLEESVFDQVGMYYEKLQSWQPCTISNADPAVVAWNGDFTFPFKDGDIACFKNGTSGTLPNSISTLSSSFDDRTWAASGFVYNADKNAKTFQIKRNDGSIVSTAGESGAGTPIVAWGQLSLTQCWVFSHNLYLGDPSGPFLLNGIMSTRGSGGDQVRAGGQIEFCLYAKNPIAHNLGNQIKTSLNYIKNCVYLENIMRVTLPDSVAVGWGPMLTGATYNYDQMNEGTLEMHDNICASAGVGTGGGAFQVGPGQNNCSTYNNIVYKWEDYGDTNNPTVGSILTWQPMDSAGCQKGSGGTGAIFSYQSQSVTPGTSLTNGAIQFINDADITDYSAFSFTGSIAGTTLTVTTVPTNGKSLTPGSRGRYLGSNGVTAGTHIISQLTSTEDDQSLGKRGTYTVSASQTVGSGTITSGDSTDGVYSNQPIGQYWHASGSGATATITVEGGVIAHIQFLAGDNKGTGYATGDTLRAYNPDVLTGDYFAKVNYLGQYTCLMKNLTTPGRGSGAYLTLSVDMDGTIHGYNPSHDAPHNTDVVGIWENYAGQGLYTCGVRLPGTNCTTLPPHYEGTGEGTGFYTDDIIGVDPSDPNYANIPEGFSVKVGSYIYDPLQGSDYYPRGVQFTNDGANAHGEPDFWHVACYVAFGDNGVGGIGVTGLRTFAADTFLTCGKNYLVGDVLKEASAIHGITGVRAKVATVTVNTSHDNKVDVAGTNPYSWSDPDRTIERYDAEVLGGPGTFDHFIDLARRNNKSGPWDSRLTARAVNIWIAGGFDLQWGAPGLYAFEQSDLPDFDGTVSGGFVPTLSYSWRLGAPT